MPFGHLQVPVAIPKIRVSAHGYGHTGQCVCLRDIPYKLFRKYLSAIARLAQSYARQSYIALYMSHRHQSCLVTCWDSFLFPVSYTHGPSIPQSRVIIISQPVSAGTLDGGRPEKECHEDARDDDVTEPEHRHLVLSAELRQLRRCLSQSIGQCRCRVRCCLPRCTTSWPRKGQCDAPLRNARQQPGEHVYTMAVILCCQSSVGVLDALDHQCTTTRVTRHAKNTSNPPGQKHE